MTLPMSIEFVLSPLIKKLLANNCIKNSRKEHGTYHIERVDNRQYGGGYGFFGDWLKVFHLFIYMYAYQRVTKEDLIEYLYAFRQREINPNFHISTVSFLADPNKRVVTLNENLQNDFSKYELMNALQNILKKELYFPNSYLGLNGEESVKKIMQDYTRERECILELTESIYTRRLNKNL